jgi:hypothetical protein
MRRYADVEVVEAAGQGEHRAIVLVREVGELARQDLRGGIRSDREHR